MGKVHNVIALREVEAREGKWVTLAAAQRAGYELREVMGGIGPRVRGMVYLGAYWGHVSTVHEVFVCVAPAGPCSNNPRRMLPRRAVSWEIAEESASDHGRIRWHCTSWDRRNQPLLMITD